MVDGFVAVVVLVSFGLGMCSLLVGYSALLHCNSYIETFHHRLIDSSSVTIS